ncbi:MAG TPA: tetratricopeptide repeat protein [Thermoanaerobaculia bacterium]|nr:tetratricopeptide repeat protein [Thermoanaerobaculia bacterium]
MKLAAILLVITLPFGGRFTRETNSHAATARGVEQFKQKKYAEAQKSFAAATAIAATPARSFNLGTSQIAAGNREAGSSTIAKALADPSLRADALFNRGNSALSASAFDYAIRDYTDALRIRPSDVDAKRNLEIALRRKQAMQKQQGGGSGSQHDRGPEPQPSPKAAGPQQPKNDPNVDGLLRSVQQQEQEELSRMHKPSRERLHVGW